MIQVFTLVHYHHSLLSVKNILQKNLSVLFISLRPSLSGFLKKLSILVNYIIFYIPYLIVFLRTQYNYIRLTGTDKLSFSQARNLRHTMSGFRVSGNFLYDPTKHLFAVSDATADNENIILMCLKYLLYDSAANSYQIEKLCFQLEQILGPWIDRICRTKPNR